MNPPDIATEDPRTPDVRALLEEHLRYSTFDTPPEDVHALEIDGLLDPSVTFVTARRDGSLLGFGAIKHLDSDHCELKSMHVAEAVRGGGVGRALLEHLLSLAVGSSAKRISLETGGSGSFAPARAFYLTAGFEPCGPFADYREGTTSVFMTRVLKNPL